MLNVTNAGTITGTTSYGLEVTGNMDVTNAAAGTITGATAAIRANSGSISVTNFGTISSPTGFAASANANLTITNGVTGSITGGMAANLGFAHVTNHGTISGLNNIAIFAFTDVNVTNGVGGQITSLINNGIYASNGVATVVNSGTLSAGGFGYAIRAETECGGDQQCRRADQWRRHRRPRQPRIRLSHQLRLHFRPCGQRHLCEHGWVGRVQCGDHHWRNGRDPVRR
ncbi:hypothetical protein [Bradyrhizobium diazoefficiens]